MRIKIAFYLPKSWKKYSFNGQIYKNKGLNVIEMSHKSKLPLKNLEFTTDGVNWIPFDRPLDGYGSFKFRANFPNIKRLKEYSLVFDGVGNNHIANLKTQRSKGTNVSLHSYRETRLPLSLFKEITPNEQIEFEINRVHNVYIQGKHTPDSKDIRIKFSPPYLETRHIIELKKVD